ncbi:MAG: ComEC/Rec2 family competence protein [Flavisolibacter sp.]
MPSPTAYAWNKIPFLRLLIPLIAGIVLQWEIELPLLLLTALAFGSFLLLVDFSFARVKAKFRFSYLSGIFINLLFASLGGLLVWKNDIRHDERWIGRLNLKDASTVAAINEPLVEKTNSYKATASVQGIYCNKQFKSCDGNIIIYFKKDSTTKQLSYGSLIIFNKPIQLIKNTGNPGSFDFKRYSLFQGITHQVYLAPDDFTISPSKRQSSFRRFIYDCRAWVINAIQTSIRSEKEQGLAEALLIGYKDDLDKTLVQSYTNTGVVHIIAISGMHLALIYGLLILLTKPLAKGGARWVRLMLIVAGLWLFTLLAGAQASVVRSAVMFTCIAWGEALSRKASIYNTLALSAFLLLAYNPFWLWDVGFQLSYAAVLSIVAFYMPIYKWFYFPNKLLDFTWKTMAISLAAQILTTPLTLYHFHQFPVLFLLTNVVAVPLSSLILFGEIFICAFSWLKPLAIVSGRVIEIMIYWMNSYIEMLESVSFSLWKGFSITVIQTVLLFIVTIAICTWLTERKKWMLWTALCSLMVFMCLRSASLFEAYAQKKLIVYNVPKYSAIDLVDGRGYSFIGDSALLYDDYTRNFHVEPCRVLHRLQENQTLPISCKEFEFGTRRIAIIDCPKHFKPLKEKEPIDILILSKNPRVYISDLSASFSIKQIVIDGSVPAWKARLWKRDCDSLNINCFDVVEKGAFVMNL